MRHLSLFTGGGGGEYAAILLGWQTVAYVEFNGHCRRVIAQRIADGIFHDGPVFGDIRAFDGQPWRGRVDVVTAGFPCQPFSVAGKGLGADDERNMWPDTLRVIREVEPVFVFLENSPGLLDSRGRRYTGVILGELATLGFDAAWTVLGADAVGAPHKRDRWWCLAAHPERYALRTQQEHFEGSEGPSFAPDVGDARPSNNADRERELQPGGPGRIGRWSSHRLGETPAYVGSEGLQRRGISERAREERAARRGSSWWSVEPGVVCVVHGLANRGERIRALGNGQVPAVAACAFVGVLERLLSSWETL